MGGALHTVPNMTLQITLYFTFVFCQNLNFAKNFHQHFYDFHGAHLDDFSSKIKETAVKKLVKSLLRFFLYFLLFQNLVFDVIY